MDLSDSLDEQKGYANRSAKQNQTAKDADNAMLGGLVALAGSIYFASLLYKEKAEEAKAWVLDLIAPMRTAALGGPNTDPGDFAPFGSPQWFLLLLVPTAVALVGWSGAARICGGLRVLTKAAWPVGAVAILGVVVVLGMLAVVTATATWTGVLGAWLLFAIALGRVARFWMRERKA